MALLPNVDRINPPSLNQSKLIGIGAAVVAGLFLLFLANPFIQIPSGYAGVLSNFGSVQQTPLAPGLHFIIPIYQSVQEVSVQPQTVTSDESGSTHDLQLIDTSIAVTFHVNPDNAPNFYQNFRDFDTLGARIITPAVSNDVKAVTADYDAEELVTKRDAVAAEIKSLIVQSLAPYSLTVEAVNVSNFAFSDAYTLQAQYTLQQTQITAQQQVVQAKAQADAAVDTAQGQANALLLTSQAQSKANLLVAQSLTPVLLQQKALDRWNGVLPTYLSPGAPMPFIGDAAIAGAAVK